MKVREMIVVFGGIIGLLIFIGLMFNNYIKSQEIRLIEKNLYYDSLLLVEQKILKEKDSIIISQQNTLKKMLDGHAGQLINIRTKVKELEKEDKNETIF